MALAIITVFCIGWVKLIWVNRFVKRQEVVDEEKRVKIQQLRMSGQIVESRKSLDVPFGIRAIQSGIKVDGIWISGGKETPMKLGELPRGSSDSSIIDSAKSQVTVEKAPMRPSSRQVSPPTNTISTPKGKERSESPALQNAYKPRRSSHLRYDNGGDYDKETLEVLEGNRGSPPRKKLYTHRPRQGDVEGDSSAADNERSEGASSDSDATLSHKPKNNDRTRQSLLAQQQNKQSRSSFGVVSSGQPTMVTHPPQSSKAQYFSIPFGSPKDDAKANPFETPVQKPPEEPYVQQARSSNNLVRGIAYNPLSSHPPQTHSNQPFIPGELHANTAVRKVNSGFEILPVGTFGVPQGMRRSEEEEDSGDKRQSRLQKKSRNSTSSRRVSSNYERP